MRRRLRVPYMLHVHVMPGDPDLLHRVLLDLHMLDRRLCLDRLGRRGRADRRDALRKDRCGKHGDCNQRSCGVLKHDSLLMWRLGIFAAAGVSWPAVRADHGATLHRWA